MDLVDYIQIISETIKNILIGLLFIALLIGLGYGIYYVLSHISFITAIILFVFFAAYWIGKNLRNE